MSTILKLEEIYLPKLNNAEFTFFAGQICTFVKEGTVEALHVPQATYSAFSENHDKLVELVDQSRIAAETTRITELDKQIDDLLSFCFLTVKTGCDLPIEAKRKAAQALQNVMKPYFGIQALPQRQQVQMLEGLLKDLKKDENKPHLTALGLSEELVYLEEMNAECLSLIESRAATQLANPAESAKPIRTEMYDQYDVIATTAWAFSIATPSEALTTFVIKVNKLIADTTLAYNQRMAERTKKGAEVVVESDKNTEVK